MNRFYVGQQVVALISGVHIIKDNIYLVEDITSCSCGPSILIDSGGDKSSPYCRCGSYCGLDCWYFEKYFAPLETKKESDKWADEVLTKIKEPELV